MRSPAIPHFVPNPRGKPYRSVTDRLRPPINQNGDGTMMPTKQHDSAPPSLSVASKQRLLLAGWALLLALVAEAALAHGVGGRDQGFLTSSAGFDPGPFMYLGAKHMVTGYDHLLFLAGVIFFLHRVRDVALYVTLFAIGHSVTLLAGVLSGIHINAYLIDAIIGLSVAYKALENMGAFETLGIKIDSRKAVLIFGLFHGLGLATKLQDLALSKDGLIGNMVAFNLGVELGQFSALAVILIGFNEWRASGRFLRHAYTANWILLTAGLVLAGTQLMGYFTS